MENICFVYGKICCYCGEFLVLQCTVFQTHGSINYIAEDMCAPKRDDEAAVCGTIVGDAAVCGNNDW
jgi:hypothetical protein